LVVYAFIDENEAIQHVGKLPAEEVLDRIRQEQPRTKDSVFGTIHILDRRFFGLSDPDDDEPF
jgi:hypothetical protein